MTPSFTVPAALMSMREAWLSAATGDRPSSPANGPEDGADIASCPLMSICGLTVPLPLKRSGPAVPSSPKLMAEPASAGFTPRSPLTAAGPRLDAQAG